MIAIVRITGDVNLKKEIRKTLENLNLRKKYSCTVLNESKENIGMIKKVRDFTAFGKIDKETLNELVEKRGQLIDKTKKVDLKKAIDEIGKGKKLKDVGLKHFFRLHPPRKGIESKKHFGVGKGVLGDNKEKINELIRRML